MTRVFVSLLFAMCVCTTTAHGASMCIHPASGSSTNVAPGTADGNRGTWARGSQVIGEAHCSAVSMIGPDTTMEQFEKYGNYCYCRVTQVAAPNGYMANRSGGWVLNDYLNSCSTRCANNCADDVGSYRGFRRALFVSPGS